MTMATTGPDLKKYDLMCVYLLPFTPCCLASMLFALSCANFSPHVLFRTLCGGECVGVGLCSFVRPFVRSLARVQNVVGTGTSTSIFRVRTGRFDSLSCGCNVLGGAAILLWALDAFCATRQSETPIPTHSQHNSLFSPFLNLTSALTRRVTMNV
jgi:hypothetical protein